MFPIALQRQNSRIGLRCSRSSPASIRIGHALLAWATILAAAGPCCAVDGAAEGPKAPTITPYEVDRTVEKAVAYVWSKQLADGRWEKDANRVGTDHDGWQAGQGDTFGGYTALSVYALLAAGEKHSDPRMIKAIEFLKKADIIGVYPLGMRCAVWLSLGNNVDTRALMAADRARLEAGLNRTGKNAGLWDYGNGHGLANPDIHRVDHSVSQYGVLGLWGASQLDVPASPETWNLIEAAWRKGQNADGGWTYTDDGRPSTASMTAAGIATLFIVRDVHGNAMTVTPRGKPAPANPDQPMDDGLNWMTSHFNEVETNYNWYGVERIAAASGYKYFGKVDWYSRGTANLIKTQKEDGSWPGTPNLGMPISDTDFALLFLCHGRAPVMINKLDYSIGADGHVSDAPWNRRRSDIANLARFTGHNLEVLLNWQIINLAAPVEDWHDAPILYVAGNKALQFTPYEEAKLKLFIEQGGMILANADAPALKNAKDEFSDSVRAMGRRMFGRDFRPLPPTHPILANESYHSTRWTGDPGISGLTNGVREQMLLMSGTDPARAWQADAVKTEPNRFELGVDIFTYAVGKGDLRVKGQTFLVTPTAPVKRTVSVARLWVGANPDPEPGGWRRLDAITTNTDGTALDLHYVKLGDGSLLRPVLTAAATTQTTQPATTPSTAPSRHFRIAHLTGTTAFKLDAKQRKELADFAAAGGTLIVDAAGGSSEFADAAENELAAVFGGSPRDLGSVLPITHPVYRRKGTTITSVGYRAFARTRLGKLSGPAVRAIEEGDHAILFYSREDLTAGLVGESVDGIVGYDPVSATAIMRNLVLYSCN